MLTFRLWTQIASVLGLYFNEKQWKNEDFQQTFRRIILINVVVLISLFCIVLTNVWEDFDGTFQFTLWLDFIMCSLIYLERYWNILKMGNCTLVVESAQSKTTRNQFKRGIFLAVQVGLLLLMLADNFLLHWLCSQPLDASHFLETYIMLIFSVELGVKNAFLGMYCNLLQNFETLVKENYQNFHKIPIADCRKLENGDFLVSFLFAQFWA